MTFDEAVQEWLRRNGHIPEGTVEIKNVQISHEDGYTNDSGTSWPAETRIHFTTVKLDKRGQRHSTHRKAWASGSDPMDFARELFEIGVPGE